MARLPLLHHSSSGRPCPLPASVASLADILLNDPSLACSFAVRAHSLIQRAEAERTRLDALAESKVVYRSGVDVRGRPAVVMVGSRIHARCASPAARDEVPRSPTRHTTTRTNLSKPTNSTKELRCTHSAHTHRTPPLGPTNVEPYFIDAQSLPSRSSRCCLCASWHCSVPCRLWLFLSQRECLKTRGRLSTSLGDATVALVLPISAYPTPPARSEFS